MIKVVACVTRRSEFGRAEFDAYWRDRHGPLIRSYAVVLRIRRYVQVAILPDAGAQERLRSSRNAMPAAFDGIAETWWDSLADIAAVRATDAGVAALSAILEDERKFIDFARSQFSFGTERVFVPG